MRFIAAMVMITFGIICIMLGAHDIGHTWLVGSVLVSVLGRDEKH